MSGVESFCEEKITITEAIDRYARLMAQHDREVLRELGERGDDPEEVLRSIELYGATESPLPLRDPDSVTEEECRERAAEEIIRHSVDALFTLPEYGTLNGPVQRFYAQIEKSATLYPAVVLGLLYEDGREKRGWAV